MNDYSCRESLPTIDDVSLYAQTYGMDFLHESLKELWIWIPFFFF